MSAVDQNWAASQCTTIVDISTSDIGAAKKLVLTTDKEHNLKSKASHGQLHGLGSCIQEMLLKVNKATPPNPCKFEVTLTDEISLGSVDELQSKLASGYVKFR